MTIIKEENAFPVVQYQVLPGKPTIKFKTINGAELPKYQFDLASGFDVTANSILAVYHSNKKFDDEKIMHCNNYFNENNSINIYPNERILFGTGLILEDIPSHLEIQVRPRSGLTLKTGLIVGNSPGTIDPDFRGHCGIIIINTSGVVVKIDKNERIAQFVPSLVTSVNIALSDEVSKTITQRGDKGFGSSGKL